MSFEHLMKNVTTELHITEKQFVQNLNKFISIVGRESFSRNTLEKDFSVEEIEVFMRFLEEVYIDSSIAYECVEYEEQEETDNPEGKCVFCGKPIKYNSSHEVDFLFTFKSGIISEMENWITLQEEKMYFIPQYMEFINDLKSSRNNIIPFIGAGLSIPFGIPGWGDMIKDTNPSFEAEFHKMTLEDYVSKGKFMKAFDYIKEMSLSITNEKQLQKKFAEIIEKREFSSVSNDANNYIDLIKLKAPFYITTNYDLILSKFLSKFYSYTTPKVFDEINDTQELHAKEDRVLHLHGHIDKTETMVVSEETYEKFYGNYDNLTKLASLIGSKNLLFIGFSFDDSFFEDLFDKLTRVIGGQHFIIVANPDFETARRFQQKDLRVIGLKIDRKEDKSIVPADYVKGIKTLFNYIV